ncbi:MAG: gliding motility-associated C-terminal domain-containing protein [Bacteroidetes bacterium]|nr:gliding motility-associated C-terminal domain-containing protein [Bacteroidota bacterium]
MKYKPTLWMLFFIGILLSGHNSTAQQSTVEAFKITFTFVEEPADGLNISMTPLKYNKDFAVVLQLNNGDPAIDNDVLPFFKGQAGNPGLFFTEGQINSIQPFKMDAVHYAFDENGEDVHDYKPGFLNWDNIINLWAGEFGIVANGLYFPPQADPAVEVDRSFSYTQRKTESGTIQGGFRTKTYVVPDNGQDQLTFARQKYLAVYANGAGSLPNPSPVESFGSISGIQVSRSPLQAGFYNQVVQLAQQSSENNHPVGTYYLEDFNSGLSFDAFKQEMNQIAGSFGRNGSDNIWVATSAELFEYLRVKELVEMQTQINGNIVEITFTADEMPIDFREYCLTLVVEGESNIVEMLVEEPDAISTYRYSGSNALLNLKWRGSVVPDIEQQANQAVEQTENQPTAAHALAAMDYVLMLQEGDLKEELRERLCVFAYDYESGFCPLNEFLGADTTVCFGSLLNYQAPEAESYLWSTGETTQQIVFETLSDTVLWAEANLGGGFIIADTVEITAIPLPDVVINTETDTIGPGDEVVLVASGARDYLWSDGSTNDSLIVMPEQTTQYIVEGTSEAGCVSSDTIVIAVEYLLSVDFIYDTVCYGNATQFFSRIESNDSILVKEWDLNGDGIFGDAFGDTVQYLFEQPGEKLTGLRVKTKSGQMELQYHAVPVADFPFVRFDFDNTCEGETVQFTDRTSVNIGFPDAWEWSFGDGSSADFKHPTHFYDAIGFYEVSLIVTSNYGCVDSASQSLSIREAPVVDLRLDDGTAVAEDAELQMATGSSLTFLVASTYDSLEWTGSVQTETFRVINAGFFDVQIYYDGCPNSRFFSVVETSDPIDPTEGIMNLITPNGDGFNDVWLIDLNKWRPAKVAVYSRAGRQVFSSNDYDNDWGGTYNGNPLPEGTYYYLIEGGNGDVIKGPISILR